MPGNSAIGRTSHAITSALALAGINLDFLVAQVVGKRYSLVIGFDSEADRKRAAALIKRAAPVIGKIAGKIARK